MRKINIGQRLYFSVLSIFLAFSVAFIVFQQEREKQYKIDFLDLRLQDYNARLADHLTGCSKDSMLKVVEHYVGTHALNKLRVTLIDKNGFVFYDNIRHDYKNFGNHANRPEVKSALEIGHGSTVDRNSTTLQHDYFYSATYFPKDSIIIRSALPYNNDLYNSLQADQHYIWFALLAILLLTILLYRFTNRLGKNINKLNTFSIRANRNESLEIEDFAEFPDDELGEIAERIIKLYKRLQNTRREQDILKRQLTQNIAHELKTPVASIQGYLETILNNEYINAATKQQFLERCYAQSERLTALLQDISMLNRMDDAPELIDFDQVNVLNLLHDIKSENMLQLEQRYMTLNIENLAHKDIIVKGNYGLLYSIFRNLVDNSIAYAGEKTMITISCKETENKWLFTYADNGVGIGKEHLDRIFERFYRVDKGRSRKMGGTGLGLAIVKNAVILHGGTIQASIPIGGGIQFDFALRK